MRTSTVLRYSLFPIAKRLLRLLVDLMNGCYRRFELHTRSTFRWRTLVERTVRRFERRSLLFESILLNLLVHSKNVFVLRLFELKRALVSVSFAGAFLLLLIAPIEFLLRVL